MFTEWKQGISVWHGQLFESNLNIEEIWQLLCSSD